jgi:hypothetical protein
MRRILPLLSLSALVACQQGEGEGQQDAAAVTTQAETTYSGQGRNQLCLKGGRTGFIVYASEGDTNCSVRGKFERNGTKLVISPDGDSECRIEAREEGSSIALGAVAPACSYYCGPEASYEGATLGMVPKSRPVTDLAGDPLC